MNAPSTFPTLGFGLGLRPKHYPHIFEHWPAVDWFEVISENFMDTDGRPKRNLARIKERYPVVMHGVAMSIGTVDPLNSEYLKKLKDLIKWLQPAWLSDHLCWTGIAHKNSHDLLPVLYTEEALKHIVSRIKQVQDYLEMPIALENPSTYLEFKTSSIPEAEFIARMAEESGCNLLLDVNNVYVSCYNHRLDAKAYLDALPLDRVIQIHLSGHSNYGTHIIDTHDDHVVDPVWQLYKYVVHKAGRTPNTMIEWDDKIPDFDVLYAELGKAKAAAADAAHFEPLPQLAQSGTPYRANQPTPLAQAQTHMQDAILRGASFDSNPDAWIRAKEQFAPADQLGVYVNAYRYRLYDVTAEDYPVLKYAMGDTNFDRLITDFVNAVAPDHFNIGRYATKLPAYLAAHALNTPFLNELCMLETVLTQLGDAEETQALEPKHLEGMTPEVLMESRLYPRKALALHAFEYPVNAYYRAVMEDENPSLPDQQKSYTAVFRHDDVMWRMDFEEDEYRLLEVLFGGASVGAAIEQVTQQLALAEDALAAKLSEWFARWMRNGLLAVPYDAPQQHERIAA